MTHASEPAWPVTLETEGGPDTRVGLTKREAFAMAAMQGIRAGMSYEFADYEKVARMAVNQADYLLDQLSKDTPA